jgi:chromosome partitioning protein
LRVIAVANQKGGCGKTTTSINFAACLAFLQKKTLLIDLDPQGHSTCGLGIKQIEFPSSLYDLLSYQQKKPSLANLLTEVEPNLFLIPTYGSLVGLEEELVHFPEREKRLKTELARIKNEHPDIDYVVLDCPPNLGVLTYNALEAADEIIIPIEPSFFSLHGLAKISETLNTVNHHRREPIVMHALLTLFDARTCFAKEVYEDVTAHFQDRLFKSIIHESVLLKECASAGQSIAQYDRQSAAFKDYFNLAVEFLEKQWDRLLPAKHLGWDQVVQHHYGPKKVSGGVLFQAMSKNAHGVEIAGDFNNWIPEPLVRRSTEGLWQKIVPITNGSFRYKFIVDGEWQLDPAHPMQQMNAFGTFDSYLELS